MESPLDWCPTDICHWLVIRLVNLTVAVVKAGFMFVNTLQLENVSGGCHPGHICDNPPTYVAPNVTDLISTHSVQPNALIYYKIPNVLALCPQNIEESTFFQCTTWIIHFVSFRVCFCQYIMNTMLVRVCNFCGWKDIAVLLGFVINECRLQHSMSFVHENRSVTPRTCAALKLQLWEQKQLTWWICLVN